MTTFLQVLVTGFGLGATYALLAQGVVLTYRGSGIVNFGQGAVGMLAAYLAFVTFNKSWGLPVALAIALAIVAVVVVSLAFQFVVLRRLRNAAPIVRLIATLGLLIVLQSSVQLIYGSSHRPVFPFLPHDTYRWGGVVVQEQVLYIVVITLVVTFVLWALGRYSTIGLAITAASENERAVQTVGWSPDRLAALTWGLGGALAGLAGILLAPLTGLSIGAFTLIVTVAAMAAALLGGFRSFPLTLVGGLVVGLGEAAVTRYRPDIQDFFGVGNINGLERAVPFLVILVVLVVRGKGLPLRSHLTDRLPKLGNGHIYVRALVPAAGLFTIVLFFVMDDRWAAATYVSLSSAVLVLSIVVLTGFAGQLSLGQWALAGCGALFAGSLIQRLGWPAEVAIPLGILLTIPVGLLFALPALRTRGVNLAIVTLGLGFTIQAVIFGNGALIGQSDSNYDFGTRIGEIELFGIPVGGANHPHAWAFVCLVAFVGAGLLLANLRRSRTGRRLIAVRTNERAAASLGVSVLGVKLYAFGLAAAIAGLGGILFGFRGSVVSYEHFSPYQSITSVGWAVIGGLGYVVGAVASAPNALGGLGTRLIDQLLSLGAWDALLGGALVLLMVVVNQDGIAEVVSTGVKPLAQRLHLIGREEPPAALTHPQVDRVTPKKLEVRGLTVRFGGVVAVDDASFEVAPGEVVGLIGPNGAGKTTVIDVVTGFVRPTGGVVELDGDEITRWSATKRSRARLRRSFQSLELFDDIDVEENLRAGSDAAPWWSWLSDLVWPGRHALAPTAVDAVNVFGLEPHLSRMPSELPYGTRRLVGIARSVASGPSIVMLDEPAAGLNEVESRKLAALIRSLADDRGMGVLLVEHDVGLVMSTCDRVVVLDYGRVIASGTPAEVRADEAVKIAYLGADHDQEMAVST